MIRDWSFGHKANGSEKRALGIINDEIFGGILGLHGCITARGGHECGVSERGRIREMVQRFRKMLGFVEQVGTGPWERLRKRKRSNYSRQHCSQSVQGW